MKLIKYENEGSILPEIKSTKSLQSVTSNDYFYLCSYTVEGIHIAMNNDDETIASLLQVMATDLVIGCH